MSEDTYAITPQELQSAAWRGSLYTLIAAIITGAALMFLAEALQDVFIVSLFTFAGVGWASGAAMRRAFTHNAQLPARVLAVLFALLGILGTKFCITLFSMMLFADLPPAEGIMQAIYSFGPSLLDWLFWVSAFEDPMSSTMMLATPIIGCAIAWKSTTGQGDVIM